MKFSIAAVPTGELNIDNEIKLIKSVLLYADDITINSLAVTMLNVIDNINIEKHSVLEMINIMEQVNPFIKMSNQELSFEIDNVVQQVNSIKPLLKKKHRNKYEILATNMLNKPSNELRNAFDEVIKIANDILDSSGYRELLKTGDKLKFEAYHSNINDTDGMMKEYFNKVLEATENLSIFPVFDKQTAELIRLYENENININNDLKLDHNAHGAIVSNMFLKLPALDFLSIEQLLEIRESLKEYLINFRKAIYEFSTKVNCSQWNEGFEYEMNKIYDIEVLPQIEELKQRIKDNSLIEKILKENYIDKSFWVTLVGTVGMALSDTNMLLQAITSASFVGSTICNTVKASYNYCEINKEIKKNTMYFYYKANNEMEKIIKSNK